MSSPYVPRKGDVVNLDFDPQSGHEQAGRRPAIILTRRDFNDKVSLALVCPITLEVKGYPFEVAVPVGHTVSGVILCDQIKSLDWRARNAEKVCELPNEVVENVVAKIHTLLEMAPHPRAVLAPLASSTKVARK